MAAISCKVRLARALPRGRGCLLTAAVWLAVNLALAAALLLIFALHAAPIMTQLARVTFASVAPYHFAMLDPRHSSAERRAFSNAYYHIAAVVETNAVIFAPPPVLNTFNALLYATKDQFISRAESAAFVSNVAALADMPALPTTTSACCPASRPAAGSNVTARHPSP